MKSLKLSLATLVGLALTAASAHAQVEINLSGAVAFRDTAYRSIRNLFGANLASQNPADAPATPTALKVTWTGKLPQLYGDQNVIVRAFYNGAVAGVQDLTQNRNVNFLASSTPGDTNTVNLQSDIAFSSIFQQATEFKTPRARRFLVRSHTDQPGEEQHRPGEPDEHHHASVEDPRRQRLRTSVVLHRQHE